MSMSVSVSGCVLCWREDVSLLCVDVLRCSRAGAVTRDVFKAGSRYTSKVFSQE